MKRSVTFQWIKDDKVKRFTDVHVEAKDELCFQEYLKRIMQAIQNIDGVKLVNSYYKDL